MVGGDALGVDETLHVTVPALHTSFEGIEGEGVQGTLIHFLVYTSKVTGIFRLFRGCCSFRILRLLGQHVEAEVVAAGQIVGYTTNQTRGFGGSLFPLGYSCPL